MRAEEFLYENIIEPSPDQNVMSFWHGGDLTDTSMRPQKKGRFEYGAGLYLITKYDTAAKYAKGSRKLYLVNVHKGNELSKVSLDITNAKEFINTYVKTGKRKQILQYLDQNIERMGGTLHANVFNNLILNSEGISPAHTTALSSFLVNNGVDYDLISSPFGWGDATMMVLFNTDKIQNITRITPKDKIQVWDLPSKF